MQGKAQRRSGLLLSAEQFGAAHGTRLAHAGMVDQHVLLASLPAHVVQRLSSPGLPHAQGFAVVEDDAGLRGALLSLEAGGVQVVLVVPLLVQAARDWLFEAVERRRQVKVALQVDAGAGLEFLCLARPVAQPEAAAWQALRQRIDAETPEGAHLAQLLQLAQLLRHAERRSRALQQHEVGERWVVGMVAERRDAQRLREDCAARQADMPTTRRQPPLSARSASA